jgi:choline/glycine/proline betaine transport protein
LTERLQRLYRHFVSHMNPPVWLGSAGAVIAFVLFGCVMPETARVVFAAVQGWIVAQLGWFYILTASGLLLFVLWMMAGPFGHIRLGPDDSHPEFRNVTWFSMLLAAGMGIGIVFFGVAEPLQHYANPPVGEGMTEQARREAMRFTFFHWGLHPWAIYTAIALPLAYFHFRHDLPLAPRSLLFPLLGERIHGWMGHVVDVLCVTGTLFGVATSLGLGSIQINAGLERLFGFPNDTTVQILLIAGITAIATVSVVTGVKGGIRALSTANIGLAALLLIFVLITGPTVYLLDLFVSSIGYYLQKLPETSFYIAPGETGDWQSNWTLFYWSWWISWSPFVGVFVARISKGRTIREFILAALLVPTTAGFLWFSVVGGTGLHAEMNGAGEVLAAAQDDTKGSSLFAVLALLPWEAVTSVLAILLIFIFFVTSSDSGSLVDDMVTSGGDPNPPTAQRIFWALAEGSVAATLLLAGGLQALRSASLITGLPMSLVLIAACLGMRRALHREQRKAHK